MDGTWVRTRRHVCRVFGGGQYRVQVSRDRRGGVVNKVINLLSPTWNVGGPPPSPLQPAVHRRSPPKAAVHRRPPPPTTGGGGVASFLLVVLVSKSLYKRGCNVDRGRSAILSKTLRPLKGRFPDVISLWSGTGLTLGDPVSHWRTQCKESPVIRSATGRLSARRV